MSRRHFALIDPIPPLPPVMGMVAVDVALRVSAAEMRGWPPAVIDRFFAGIAMATDARRLGQIAARALTVQEPSDDPS